MLEKATSKYAAALVDDLEAFAYLADRGLDEQVVLTSRLGVVRDAEPTHEKYEGWLAIPYLSGDGHPVQIRFRCIQDHQCRERGHGKYATISGDRGRMFNVRSIALAADTICLTEGELDALILEQCGLPAVAVPGANLWQPHFRHLLAGFSKVYVFADPDAAGSEMLNKVLKTLPQAVPVTLREGDVNETYLRHGRSHMTDCITEASR